MPVSAVFYTQVAANNCHRWLVLLGEHEYTIPDLIRILTEAKVRPAVSEIASTTAQPVFIPGFALDQARAEFWEERVRRDGIFAALVKGFPTSTALIG
jgi:hypothetical protein